ncbi:hypothetical protein CERSUDRAFT_65353 [Gelatoporia subvermispora B]|uniref:Uncharacterized protein n=1 Tax=Ceriporiopsis subvermispora (strain B) TaxID=914234 RepID=M2PMW0_CERS8|nr:hypothetical protein CERSUDRAFT_65353 [Gelatoporia subvermispora B]
MAAAAVATPASTTYITQQPELRREPLGGVYRHCDLTDLVSCDAEMQKTPLEGTKVSNFLRNRRSDAERRTVSLIGSACKTSWYLIDADAKDQPKTV